MDGTWAVSVFQFLGRFHPLLVHFPIGLLIGAFFLEILLVFRKKEGLREGITWMIYLGSFFSILALILGFLLRTYGDYAGSLIEQHQYFGIASSVLSLVTSFYLWRSVNRGESNFTIYRILLFCTVILLSVAGHLGASITHGANYLSFADVTNSQQLSDGKSGALLLGEIQEKDTLSEPELERLNLEVRAILAHNCYQCHSENKHKGDLILDSKEGVFRGGESGKVIIAGDASNSELYRRINLPPDHDEVMPKKGKVLKSSEIALVKLWIDHGAYWSDQAVKVFPEAPLALEKPNLPSASLEAHPIDKWMEVYFKKHGNTWPSLVDDRTFARRVYLDVVGLLPAAHELQRFIENNDPNKRDKLLDDLLNDNINYSKHWLSFWNDLLRNDYSGPGFITGGRKQITGWLYDALLDNKPYNIMVQELINPSPASEGFIKGIEWRGVVNASQRTEMQAAQNIGQSLMGVNVKCASCHNSFVSNLTLEQSYGFAAIFADTLLELNRCDVPLGIMANPNFLYKELGTVEADSLRDRLLQLSEIIVKPANGRLYRTICNRIWQKLLGRGIIEPADEMDNPPWDSNLLDWLAADFIDSGYDLKHLMKTILTSKVYQLPTVKYNSLSEVASSSYVFEGPVLRRLSAEQFTDAVSQVIAPMYYATAFSNDTTRLSARRFWHKEVKFERTILPAPGDRYFRYKLELSEKEMLKATALISVDHSYECYVNESLVAKGDNWKKVNKMDIEDLLVPGENIIAIRGGNEGELENPAGILFAMKFTYKDSSEKIVQFKKGEGWKSTDQEPEENWKKLEFEDDEWKEAWNAGDKHWDHLVGFDFDNESPSYARASVVKQDPFMKALGRPSRENVATSRDEIASLLQALELTNGSFFNAVLQEGARSWMERHDNNSKLMVDTLFLELLGRAPTSKERKVMVASLGESHELESVQDLFWATLLLPEFQFIY